MFFGGGWMGVQTSECPWPLSVSIKTNQGYWVGGVFLRFFDKRRMEWHVYFLRFLIDFTTAISIGGKYPYSIFGPGSLPQYWKKYNVIKMSQRQQQMISWTCIGWIQAKKAKGKLITFSRTIEFFGETEGNGKLLRAAATGKKSLPASFLMKTSIVFQFILQEGAPTSPRSPAHFF